jgi:hypothetical protein
VEEIEWQKKNHRLRLILHSEVAISSRLAPLARLVLLSLECHAATRHRSVCHSAPLGLPFYWRDETSGELVAAVNAYLDNRIEHKPITAGHIALVRDFLAHYINAPCWDSCADAFGVELNWLRTRVNDLNSPEKIQRWIHKATEIGMDPL